MGIFLVGRHVGRKRRATNVNSAENAEEQRLDNQYQRMQVPAPTPRKGYLAKMLSATIPKTMCIAVRPAAP